MTHERRPGTVVNVNITVNEGGADGPPPWSGPWSPTNTHGDTQLEGFYGAIYIGGSPADMDPVTSLPDVSGHSRNASESGSTWQQNSRYRVGINGQPYVQGPYLGNAGFFNNGLNDPALNNGPATIVFYGYMSGQAGKLGSDGYLNGMAANLDHLAGFGPNDIGYQNSIPLLVPVVVTVIYDGEFFSVWRNKLQIVGRLTNDPMQNTGDFNLLGDANGQARMYAQFFYSGAFTKDDVFASVDFAINYMISPATVESSQFHLKHWFEWRTRRYNWYEQTTINWDLDGDLANIITNEPVRTGSVGYNPTFPLQKLVPNNTRVGGSRGGVTYGDSARTVMCVAEFDSGVAFILGFDGEDNQRQWGITGEKLIMDQTGTNDVVFDTPVDTSRPRVVVAQYDPATHHTKVWDEGTLILDHDHGGPIDTNWGFYLFDAIDGNEGDAAINPTAGASYGIWDFEGILDDYSDGGLGEKLVNYGRSLFSGYVDHTREANVSYTTSNSSDGINATKRNTGDGVGWDFADESGAYWQVEFDEALIIERMWIFPFLSGRAGVPHYELLASNTGDFGGEEVSLVSGDLADNEAHAAFNEIDITNSTAYTFYRLMISGDDLDELGYCLNNIFLFSNDYPGIFS